MNDFPCCALCRGISPFFFCKDKPKGVLEPGCECHVQQELKSRKKYNALTYKDTTARTAISNVLREQKASKK